MNNLHNYRSLMARLPIVGGTSSRESQINRRPMIAGFLLAISLCFVCVAVYADDSPQWRGSQRNGISGETGLLKEWPKEGPKLVWKVTDAGSGYSTPSVVGDRLYLLGNEGLENEFVECRAAKDG